ncbi:hypothetical protein BC832DRAFT_549025 [Gaertneriomyces semiglobifer]|nr:hypothetical protein BC832DRAFT_549025 [Gaertneriomyces semiglobifer]
MASTTGTTPSVELSKKRAASPPAELPPAKQPRSTPAKAAKTTRMTISEPPSMYMRIRITSSGEVPHTPLLRHLISTSIGQVFGNVAAETPVSILSFNVKSKEAVIRVPFAQATNVRAALSLTSKLGNELCRIDVLDAKGWLVLLGR